MSIEIKHNWDDENYVQSLVSAMSEYMQACYGDKKLSELQDSEIRQAFLSGIHWLNTRDSYDPDQLQTAIRTCLNLKKEMQGNV